MSKADANAIDDIKASNLRFYQALSAADLVLMSTVWSQSAEVVCLHPGWPLLRGWDEVRASWQRIFENQGKGRIWPGSVNATVSGELGWVVCTENMEAGTDPESGLAMFIELYATNIFRKEAGRWRMVLHHASQQTQPPLRLPGNLGPKPSVN